MLWYSLEASHWDASNEYHNMFLWRNMNITSFLAENRASYRAMHDTTQPLYNTIVGVHSINRVSETTVLYPNKNV